ncbi:hypothetical protein KHA80_09255 [Anaerobacillus sp. HL2]|nr:hypothetical protein KHA80_09255 [Anaerobacillus sp. HL2]
MEFRMLINPATQKGFSSPNGTINQQHLAEQFLHYYGEEYLSLVQSKVSINNPSCWLKAITRKHRKGFHQLDTYF